MQTVRALILLFWYGFLLFLFLLWLLWLGLPELCWIIVVKVGILVLFLICFHFFTIKHNVCCRLILYGLYYVEIGSFYAHRVLIINECWILSKAFSAFIEIIIWFLSFNLLIWCITLIDLHILKNPCIPGISPTWSLRMSFLMCYWILFAKILLRILHLYSSVILACSFLFLCFLCLVLVSGWWWPCRMSFEVFLPLQFFERVLEV